MLYIFIKIITTMSYRITESKFSEFAADPFNARRTHVEGCMSEAQAYNTVKEANDRFQKNGEDRYWHMEQELEPENTIVVS